MANAMGSGLSGVDWISVARHVSRAVADLVGQVDVALKEIRIDNRSNAEHSGLTFSLVTFVIGQLVFTRRMFRPFWATKAVRSARGPSRGSSQSGAQHLD
jgi:hypothetical protein